MRSMRLARRAAAFRSAPRPIGSMASSRGRPMQTPAARRKARRLNRGKGMVRGPQRKGTGPVALEVLSPFFEDLLCVQRASFVQKQPALHHVMDQRPKAGLLLPAPGDDLLHHLPVSKLDVGAGGIDEELL